MKSSIKFINDFDFILFALVWISWSLPFALPFPSIRNWFQNFFVSFFCLHYMDYLNVTVIRSCALSSYQWHDRGKRREWRGKNKWYRERENISSITVNIGHNCLAEPTIPLISVKSRTDSRTQSRTDIESRAHHNRQQV